MKSLPLDLKIFLKLRSFYWYLRGYPKQYCGSRHPNGYCATCEVRKLRHGVGKYYYDEVAQ
jgi:hypothetical protein